MSILHISNALKSQRRLNILTILKDKKISANEVYINYKNIYDDKVYRESIYRDLEELVQVNLLVKEYDQNTKRLNYILTVKKIIIHIAEDKVEYE